MFRRLRADIEAAKRNDPAARNKFEIWLTYSGVHALSWHRFANRLYKMHLKLLARMVSQWAKFLTGIEIHPAAKIEGGVFIDHGAGVVIGETAEVKSGAVIYQGVTLGGTGKEKGKRHPSRRTPPSSASPAASCASAGKSPTSRRRRSTPTPKRYARSNAAYISWKPRWKSSRANGTNAPKRKKTSFPWQTAGEKKTRKIRRQQRSTKNDHE